MEILNNEQYEKCSKCGGKCCKRIPGSYHPSDFKPEQLTKEGLIDLIKNHKISIDAYQDSDYRLFLRPRQNTDKCYGFWSYGGTCLHLTATGCELSFEERPFGCRVLDPNTCGKEEAFNKMAAAEAWSEYNQVLTEIVEEMKISLFCNCYTDYRKEEKVLEEVREWAEKNPTLHETSEPIEEKFLDILFGKYIIGGINEL